MPEDIKKKQSTMKTAENKAEEIEIEGADEESTQEQKKQRYRYE